MAIATGTALLIGAGVAAAGTTAAGAIQARGNSRALDAASDANRMAIEHEKNREDRAMEQYRLDKADYDARLQEWYNRHGDEGLNRYGVSQNDILFPGTGPRGNTGNRQSRPTPPPTTPTAPTALPAPPQNLGTLMGTPGMPPQAPGMPGGLMDSSQPGPGVTGPGMAAPGTLGDLGGWADWRRYGAGGM